MKESRDNIFFTLLEWSFATVFLHPLLAIIECGWISFNDLAEMTADISLETINEAVLYSDPPT